MEYFKDYYLNGKYIGSKLSEKDREVFGYIGRTKEISKEVTVLSNGKKIKPNVEFTTELQILCVKK